MEELKLLIGMVADLPQMALWVLIGYLVYKLAVIGSIYGVIKLGIDQLFAWLRVREDRKNPAKQPVELRATIDAMCITADGSHSVLIAQLDRLRGKGTGINSTYIHKQSVQWLREAIDAKEEADAAKKVGA